MIVGCYTLHLYCDDPTHFARRNDRPWRESSLDAEFTGNTETDCKRQARAKGWKFKADECTCPYCVTANRPHAQGTGAVPRA